MMVGSEEEMNAGSPGKPGQESVGGRGGAGGEGGKGGRGLQGKAGGPGGKGGAGGDRGRQHPESIPVVVTDVAPTVNYRNTLRYIAVMLTAILIVLLSEWISKWT